MMSPISNKRFEEACYIVYIMENKRHLYLASGTFALFVLGLIYAWSIFAVALELDRTASATVFSTTMICFCVGSLAASSISTRFNPKVSIWLSGLLLALGFTGLALFHTQGTWALLLFYGVFVGISNGVGYNAILTTVNLWYPDRIGFASGVQLVGFGMSGLILGTAANEVIKSFGIQMAFAALAIIGAAVLIGFGFLIRVPVCAVTSGSTTPGSSSDDIVGQGDNVASPAEKSLGYLEMIKTPDTILFYLWRIVLLGTCITLVGNSGIDARELGFSTDEASILVGLVAVGNGAARIIAGFIYDKLGIRFLTAGITALVMVCSFALAIAFLLNSAVLFAIAAVLMGCAYGSLPVVSATFSRERFGAINYAKALAIINSNVAFGSFLSMAIVFLSDSLGGEATSYAISGVLALASALLLRGFSKQYQRRRATIPVAWASTEGIPDPQQTTR